MEKQARFEILLEEVRDQVKTVAEGHGGLRSEMKQMEERLGLRISEVDSKVDFLGSKVSSLDKKIDAVHSSLKNEIKVTAMILDEKIDDTRIELGAKIDRLGYNLDQHIKQPMHAAI